MKTYKQLNLEEREMIAMLRFQGHSIRKIAFVLNRSPATLSREIRRNRDPMNYRASKAHRKARFRLLKGHRKQSPLDKDPLLCQHVIRCLKNRWSPEIIAGRLKREAKGRCVVSHEAIYRWIYLRAPHLIACLLRSHPRRWKRSSRSWIKRHIHQRVSIHARPDEVHKRHVAGHWETDLVWGEGKAALQVLVERKTRLVRIKRLPNKTAQASFECLSSIFAAVPAHLRRSITYDNGVENLLHSHLNSRFGLRSYFCDPFQAWQKGSVENTNSLIRRFLPKNTNFDTIADPNLGRIEFWLNNRPRKCLHFQTSAEAYKSATVALGT